MQCRLLFSILNLYAFSVRIFARGAQKKLWLFASLYCTRGTVALLCHFDCTRAFIFIVYLLVFITSFEWMNATGCQHHRPDTIRHIYKGLKMDASWTGCCRFIFIFIFYFPSYWASPLSQLCAAYFLRVAVNSRYCSSGSNCCRRAILIRRRFIASKSTFCVGWFWLFRRLLGFKWKLFRRSSIGSCSWRIFAGIFSLLGRHALGPHKMVAAIQTRPCATYLLQQQQQQKHPKFIVCRARSSADKMYS